MIIRQAILPTISVFNMRFRTSSRVLVPSEQVTDNPYTKKATNNKHPPTKSLGCGVHHIGSLNTGVFKLGNLSSHTTRSPAEIILVPRHVWLIRKDGESESSAMAWHISWRFWTLLAAGWMVSGVSHGSIVDFVSLAEVVVILRRLLTSYLHCMRF